MTFENPDVKIASLHLPANLDHLPAFLSQIREIAQTARLTDAQIPRLELAVEEALVNVFNHAYAGQIGTGAVFCQVTVKVDSLLVDIVDEGPLFDPLACPDPDTNLELDQRQPGGLGLLLIKRLVDEVRYRREEGRNMLTLQMNRAKASDSG
ncbi:MAG: ATP-binding protein [Gammaproteobacteria bacterium]|nr:ATP-binding protein [Gammaproteobacteria bacterium]